MPSFLSRGESDRRRSHRRASDPAQASIDAGMRRVRDAERSNARSVEVVRLAPRGFEPTAPDYLVATDEALVPSQGIGRAWHALHRFLIGRPIPTAGEVHERLTKIKALAIFSSDALSSVAYATEEIMKVLILVSVGALALTLPVSLAIAVLLAIVATSYQQTIRAYPHGGGSYTVASDNLGTLPGLVAAAALLIDYVLTVAVSIAAGIEGLTSAFAGLYPFRVELMVLATLLVMIANLRGVRESGSIFALPTYIFVASVLGLIGYGIFKVVVGAPVAYTPPPGAAATPHVAALSVFLILSAFAQGCSAMTGTEAIANGVPAFKPPEAPNARITLAAMAFLLGIMFLGISFLASHYHILPDPTEQETVVSQLARALAGSGWFFYVLQFSTMLILVLAANTSFADFPRLSSILARDRFLPNQFSFRGDRLAFTTGIIFLAAIAIGLLVIFDGSVDRLIPLYAVGVFTAFTLSQAGMVQHWRRLREPGWRWRAWVNGVGSVTTAVVVVVIGATKFEHGAWMVIVLIPFLVLNMLAIHRHYATLARDLRLRPGDAIPRALLTPAVVVPIGTLNRATVLALAYARSLSPDVTAIHVTEAPERGQAFRQEWDRLALDTSLIVVESPYRALRGPLLLLIDALNQEDPQRPITVVLPEFVPRHWWEYPLHNQTALWLKLALFFRPNTIVVDFPYHVAVPEFSEPTSGSVADAREPTNV